MNRLSVELPTAQQITSEVTEDMVQRTNQFLTYWNEHIPSMITFGIHLLISLVIFLIGRIVIRWIRSLVRRSIQRSSADKGVEQFIDSLLKFILYLFLLLIIIQNLGVSSTSIAAAVASAGVAVGLALQESLSNLAGGVLILLLKPFVVGDYIREDSNGNEGTVQEIHIFHTKLATTDNRIIVIPNGILSNTSLTNVTFNDIRLLQFEVGISYQADLQKAKRLLTELLENDPQILTDQEYLVYVSDLADSSVKLGLKARVLTKEYWPTRWRLLENIKLTFDENGIEIPYSQMDVHIKN